MTSIIRNRSGIGQNQDLKVAFLPSLRTLLLLSCTLVFVIVISTPSGLASSISDAQVSRMKKLLSDGDITEGIEESKRNQRACPNAFWHEQLAIFLVHRGRINARAIKSARLAVTDATDATARGHALATLAIVLTLGNKTDYSIKVAKEALKADKDNTRATMALALASRRMGDFDHTDKMVLNAVSKAAGNVDVMFLACLYYEQAGSNADVLSTLELWTKTSPDCAYAYYLKGKYYYKALSLNLAIKEFEKAISLNPVYWNAKKECAYIYTYQKKFQEAARIFEAILSDRRGFGVTYIHYAECLEAIGQKDKAIQNYNDALEEICDTTDLTEQVEKIPHLKVSRQTWAIKACANRARLLMDTDSLDKALHDASRLTSFFPARMEPRYIKMLILTRKKEYASALREANVLIDGNEDISLFYRKRADIHRGLKQLNAADRDIELAKRLELTGSIKD